MKRWPIRIAASSLGLAIGAIVLHEVLGGRGPNAAILRPIAISGFALAFFALTSLAAWLAFSRGAWRWAMIGAQTTSAVGLLLVLTTQWQGRVAQWTGSNSPAGTSPQTVMVPISGLGISVYPPSTFDAICLLATAAIALPWMALVASASMKTQGAKVIRGTTVASVLLLAMLPPVAIFWDMTRKLEFVIAAWLVLAACALGAVAVAGSVSVAYLSWRRLRGVCSNCGYPLRSGGPRCSECGVASAPQRSAPT